MSEDDSSMDQKVESFGTTLHKVRTHSIPPKNQVSFSTEKFAEIAKAMTEGMDVNLELIEVVRKNEEDNNKIRAALEANQKRSARRERRITWFSILSMVMTLSLFGLILVRSSQLVGMRQDTQMRLDAMQESVRKMEEGMKRTNRVNKSIALAVGAIIEIEVKKPGVLDPVEAEDAHRKAVAAQLEAVEAIVAEDPDMDSDPIIDRVRNKAALMNIKLLTEQPSKEEESNAPE